MRVQVITPFHWDGVLREHGDVIDGDDAELIAADPHYGSLCTALADLAPPEIPAALVASDVPDAPAEPDHSPDVEPPVADDQPEEQ